MMLPSRAAVELRFASTTRVSIVAAEETHAGWCSGVTTGETCGARIFCRFFSSFRLSCRAELNPCVIYTRPSFEHPLLTVCLNVYRTNLFGQEARPRHCVSKYRKTMGEYHKVQQAGQVNFP